MRALRMRLRVYFLANRPRPLGMGLSVLDLPPLVKGLPPLLGISDFTLRSSAFVPRFDPLLPTVVSALAACFEFSKFLRPEGRGFDAPLGLTWKSALPVGRLRL